MNTEAIVYLLRKTNLTRSEIGKLSPPQFAEILKEVGFQEAIEEYRKEYMLASLMAAIYNTIPRKRGAKTFKAEDFIRGDMPQRDSKPIDELAKEKGITLPTKELKNRGE